MKTKIIFFSFKLFVVIALIGIISSCDTALLNPQENVSSIAESVAPDSAIVLEQMSDITDSSLVPNSVIETVYPPIILVEPTAEMLVGCWHAAPVWPAGTLDCHYFYKDGRYIFVYSQMSDLNQTGRRRHLYGKWELASKELKITIEAQGILVGGEIEYHSDMGYSVVGGELKEEKIRPSIVQKYELEDLHYDYNSYNHYSPELDSAALTMHIGEQQFWKLKDILVDYGVNID